MFLVLPFLAGKCRSFSLLFLIYSCLYVLSVCRLLFVFVILRKTTDNLPIESLVHNRTEFTRLVTCEICIAFVPRCFCTGLRKVRFSPMSMESPMDMADQLVHRILMTV